MTPLTSHPLVRRSVLPSEFSPPPTLTNSTVSHARVLAASSSVTPRSPGVCLTWSPHTGVKVHIEQTIPGLLLEPQPGAQPKGARMYVVFNLRGHTYYIDAAVVTPFSSNAGLISAASARSGYMAKREEKQKLDRYPRINLVPLQQYGPPTNSHPGRLGRHPDHLAQQHLQSTGPRRHHVTPGTCTSPPHTRSSIVPTTHSSYFTFCCLAPISACMADHLQSPQSTL